MAIVALVGFVVLMVGVTILLIDRGRSVPDKVKRRRKRHESKIPFLFFPTTGLTAEPPPVPAWHAGGASEPRVSPVKPEPGLADMPIRDEPEGVAEPTRETTRRALLGQDHPSTPSDDGRLRAGDRRRS